MDASFFLALYNETDVHHERALLIVQRIENDEFGGILTSNDVFDEVISVSLRKFGKEKAKVCGKNILESVSIIHGDMHLFQRGWKIFHRSKQDFSFTDCMILALMDLGEIKHLATFDRAFEGENIIVVK